VPNTKTVSTTTVTLLNFAGNAWWSHSTLTTGILERNPCT